MSGLSGHKYDIQYAAKGIFFATIYIKICHITPLPSMAQIQKALARFELRPSSSVVLNFLPRMITGGSAAPVSKLR